MNWGKNIFYILESCHDDSFTLFWHSLKQFFEKKPGTVFKMFSTFVEHYVLSFIIKIITFSSFQFGCIIYVWYFISFNFGMGHG